ncbi:MAG: putative manganese-dependent inorganic diphosphatase [Clostridiales Family XIII bacterium]|nr:putative manganese-dependent inorganic diphosphatase [Clostridiales Family XIII bacterium]
MAGTAGAPPKAEVFIVGHKNPDTDSICSSIAYAALKNKIDPGRHYVAKRAGRVSRETQFVLDYFSAGAPEYIDDVGTQIKDINIRRIKGVPGGITLKKAWEAIKANNIVTLPVTSTDGKLEGLITVKDIVKTYMDVNDARILSDARTSYNNIIEALDGELLLGNGNECIERGKILVAAANPDVLETFMEPGDIIITSNRYESQLCAIELNAGCIIATTGAKVADTILNFAREHSCVVISSPHDTYTTAKLMNQSVPVSYVMKRDGLVTFKSDDYIVDIKETMSKLRHRDFPVLDRHGDYYGMISRRFLLNAAKKKVILVDHNEKSQSVDGIEDAEIIEIIDHHRIGSIETMAPVYFRNQPVGCTATIIYQLYCEAGVVPEKGIAGILCAAILSDTLMYRSPTSTKVDERAAGQLAALAEIDVAAFADLMFKAGSDLEGKLPEDILYQDYKDFSLNDIDFGIGQATSMYADELEAIKGMLAPYIAEACAGEKTDIIYFMLTNIVDSSSEIMYAGEGAKRLLEEAFCKHGIGREGPGGHSVILDGVVSRKKQMAPAILAAIQEP